MNFLSKYPEFKVSVTYEGKNSDKVIVLYGKQTLYLDEYLQQYVGDATYDISIVLPSGYPYKAPKVYILDELAERDKDVISKNNKIRTEEFQDWKVYSSIDL